MTRKREGVSSGETYVPKHELIQRYSAAYNWNAETLEAVLSKFGPLPEAGQEQLCRCLCLAFGPYELAVRTIERVTPSQQRNQLRHVENAAERLLGLLEDPFIKLWLSAAGIHTAGRIRQAVNAELMIANTRVIDIVRALKDLRDRARKASETATARMKSGRGGARRRPTTKGKLIADAIAIYSHLRMHYPDSGNAPGYGGPLLRFVKAIAELQGLCLSDSEVQEVWRVCRPKQEKL